LRIKLLMVPYLGGTTQALNDVISGRVPMVIDAYPPLAGALQAGAIRALAVGSTKRLSDFPDRPYVEDVVAALAASAGRSLPVVASTATCRLTRSAANAGNRSYCPSAQGL
jgi:tripartite-type tricarboxylate transporter receptor subunit TctC